MPYATFANSYATGMPEVHCLRRLRFNFSLFLFFSFFFLFFYSFAWILVLVFLSPSAWSVAAMRLNSPYDECSYLRWCVAICADGAKAKGEYDCETSNKVSETNKLQCHFGVNAIWSQSICCIAGNLQLQL